MIGAPSGCLTTPPKGPDSPSKGPNSPSDLCEVATILNKHKEVEEELLELVHQLKEQKQIFGDPSVLNEMVDLTEEQVLGDCLDSFEGRNLDVEIVQVVQAKVRGGSVKEIGSDSISDEPEVVLPSLKEMIEVCQKL